MKVKILLLLVSISLSQTLQTKAQDSSTKFLTKKQIRNFYSQMISEIEHIDAEGIETRNTKKKIKWEKIKKHYEKKILKSKNWDELENAFTKFGSGFVNLHSNFRFYSPIKEEREVLLTDVRIGFENPKMNFFESETKQTITHLNKTPVKKVFGYFLNYECRFNSTIGCQSSFTNAFRRGRLLVKNEKISFLKLENGQTIKVNYKPAKLSSKRDYWKDFEKNLSGWKIIKKGHKVAVLQKDKVALVRIFDFVYRKGSGRDFRCEKQAEKDTLCGDVRLIRDGLEEIKGGTEYLILDVQNNRGGNENSAFIAELAQESFYDLRVRYKKTDILKDEKLRKFLFYFSGRAESWYQSLVKDGTIDKIKDGDYLPARGDFCRGSKYCKLEKIEPNKSARKFKKIVVLTNQLCVSSCDDFVWRMKEFSGASIIGQPQSADATYSRIEIAFYLDKDGKVAKKYFGDGDKTKVDGQLFAKIRIPYSRTVSANGELLQGKAAKLSRFVPITKENYSEIEKFVRIEALKYLKDNYLAQN